MRFMRESWGKDDPWWSMSQEEQLHTWLKTCPFDYLMVRHEEGLRTVNFLIEETIDDEEI